MCMGIFDAETEVRYSPRARAVSSEAFLFGADDLSTFDVVISQHDYACGPKFL